MLDKRKMVLYLPNPIFKPFYAWVSPSQALGNQYESQFPLTENILHSGFKMSFCRKKLTGTLKRSVPSIGSKNLVADSISVRSQSKTNASLKEVILKYSWYVRFPSHLLCCSIFS